METSGNATYKGRLAETTRTAVHVAGDSGSTFSATVYTAINTADAPELLAALREGTLHQVTDPHSGKRYELAQPVALHDPARPLYALYIPNALRHREIDEKHRLLVELQRDDAALPKYVREFAVVYSIDGFRSLQAAALEEARLTGEGEAFNAKLEALEDERAKLEIERQQLRELRERFDRERAQMDEVEERLSRERAELQAKRAELARPASLATSAALPAIAAPAPLEPPPARVEAPEPPPAPQEPPSKSLVDQLNEESKKIAAQHGGAPSADESTQIVTDDQFIDLNAEEADHLASEVSEIVDDGIEVFEPDQTLINAITTGLPSRFADFKTPGDRVVTIRDEHVVLAGRAPRGDIEGLFESNTDFYVQLHDLEGYPVVGLVVVNLDAGVPTGSVGWALDVGHPEHRKVLERLATGASIRAGLYEPLGSLLRAVEIQAPLRANVAWIIERASQMLDRASGTFEPAAKTYVDRNFERVGSMRHPFVSQAFEDLDAPSQAKLAAGIVGFWTQPAKYLYVVANRSFPLKRFEALQDRVVRAAVNSGIFLTPSLRLRALELKLAESEEHLAELLVANFAEVSISLKVNDLDPAQQWENWDALLGLGEELGIPPDPDVVELAEVSLKRAQELAELEESEAPQVIEAGQTFSVDRTLVVARQSESTGVTYFLPDDAIVDSFEDVATMSRDDLELLLHDAKGRLEASQVLVERFGADAVAIVLDAADTMNAPEVAALARFVETKADTLEGEMVRVLGSVGPSGTYVAVHALSSIRSTSAISIILDVLRDPVQRGDVSRLVRAVAQYGDRVLPALTRAIKRDGPMDEYVDLLAVLEDAVSGTIANLSKDRSKVLRDAARMAREKRDTR